jgi:hypothetical protein
VRDPLPEHPPIFDLCGWYSFIAIIQAAMASGSPTLVA